jgi:hypothetical protein
MLVWHEYVRQLARIEGRPAPIVKNVTRVA